ncbi:HD domain-containing protein [Sphingobacterium oryzagri]|uniref:HD domain-containing protein n=1 Tax=Sphingobacterium oryzagri TaxID=3025669 RepID=A0ABY7WCF4_9SPHI|nr:HD domain-containing protein [Sphingobacterium sp. KACC 22765]WDF66878.1 HD domain-containing protein [Sphingobacterium sp. KACC 22765]
MDYAGKLKEIDFFVQDYVENYRNPLLYFHTIQHIESVLAGINDIGNFYRLDEEAYFILKAAAYFHDLYYMAHGPANHKENSARMAKNFLLEEGIPLSVIDEVVNCIRTTQSKRQTKNDLQAIFCDADLYHLSGTSFEKHHLDRLEEIKNLRKIDIDERLWIAISLKVLDQHQFHTDYGRCELDKGKQINIKILEKKLSYLRT